MNGTKRRVVVVLVTVLVAIAVVLWLPGDSGALRSSGTDGAHAPESSEGAPLVDVTDIDATAGAATGRSAVETTPSGSPDARAAGATPPLDSSVTVEVAIADNPWLAERWRGTIAWYDEVGGDDAFRVVDGRFTLPRAPQNVEQFSRLSAVFLIARPIALTPLVADTGAPADPTEPRFALTAELESGATLVWAPSVAVGERSVVRVSLGSWAPPPTMEAVGLEWNGGIAAQGLEVDLPFVLPRVGAPTVVWIGATGRQWRSFEVRPDDTRIEVSLEPAASARVLHDGRPGLLVASAKTGSLSTVTPVVDDQPIVVGDLSSGEYEFWIGESFDEPQTRVARDVLVGGETIEVDLRAASALDGRGGVRLEVLATPEALALATQPIEPALFREATPTSKRSRHWPFSRLMGEPGLVFEALGLEPGRHSITVPAFGANTEFDIVAGEVSEVVIDIGCVGSLRFEHPTNPVLGSVELFATDTSAKSHVWLEVPSDSTRAVPIVCGSYTARAISFDANNARAFTSEPFTVTTGAIATVPLIETPVVRVEIAVIEAATGERLVLDQSIWFGVDVRDAATAEPLLHRVKPVGTIAAYNGVALIGHPYASPVLVELPEDTHWTFEPLPPLVLTDGATITLRATAK